MNVSITKTSDGIDGVVGLSALSAIYDPNIIFQLPTGVSALSAWITGVSVAETRNGAPHFLVYGNVYTALDSNSYPCLVKTSANGAVSTSSCSALSLSAMATSCANGAQILTYSITLSAQALSGANVIINIDTPTQTLTTTITAYNTPYGAFSCFHEFERIWAING